jgi:hypothetical protein
MPPLLLSAPQAWQQVQMTPGMEQTLAHSLELFRTRRAKLVKRRRELTRRLAEQLRACESLAEGPQARAPGATSTSGSAPGTVAAAQQPAAAVLEQLMQGTGGVTVSSAGSGAMEGAACEGSAAEASAFPRTVAHLLDEIQRVLAREHVLEMTVESGCVGPPTG